MDSMILALAGSAVAKSVLSITALLERRVFRNRIDDFGRVPLSKLDGHIFGEKPAARNGQAYRRVKGDVRSSSLTIRSPKFLIVSSMRSSRLNISSKRRFISLWRSSTRLFFHHAAMLSVSISGNATWTNCVLRITTGLITSSR